MPRSNLWSGGLRTDHGGIGKIHERRQLGNQRRRFEGGKVRGARLDLSTREGGTRLIGYTAGPERMCAETEQCAISHKSACGVVNKEVAKAQVVRVLVDQRNASRAWVNASVEVKAMQTEKRSKHTFRRSTLFVVAHFSS